MSEVSPWAFTHDPSATAAFAALDQRQYSFGDRTPKAVVIGGGTGAPVSIRTLLSMNVSVNAVVAMADDGGSTGILREEANATAPGDVRKCITAMAADANDPLTRAFKTRFTFAENHTLGNLMLTALEVTCGNFPDAIKICENLLHVRGHVYPSTLDRVTLVAETSDGRTVVGQEVACHARSALKRVELLASGPIVAYEPALDAIREADLIVLGPGSLFTSIIPNLLVPGVEDAIRSSQGAVLFVCSLADMQGETRGMTAIEHYNALMDHGMRGLVDYMLVHAPQSTVPGAGVTGRFEVLDDSPARVASAAYGMVDSGVDRVRPVGITGEDVRAIGARGTQVILRDLVDNEHPTWHDPAKLRHAFAEVLQRCLSVRM